MGFGLLFFGYAATFLMSLNNFGFLFRLTGCAVMLSGLSRLEAFERRFFYARICCISMFAASVIESVLKFILQNSLIELPTGIQNTVSVIFMALSVIFHILIYFAIHKISVDVGVKKIEINTVRNAVFSSLEILIFASAVTTFLLKAPFAKYLYFAAILYPFIIFLFNLALFYSCYKNICEEGDEEAPRKASKIPFLNKLFEASEKREMEIFEKSKGYAENYIKRENEEKKRKNKRKRRKK